MKNKNFEKSESERIIDEKVSQLIMELERAGHNPGVIAMCLVYCATEFSFFCTKNHAAIITNLITPILHHFHKRVPSEMVDWPDGNAEK